jgi:glycosyltransferase involved in cell wall biosynthesis
MHIYYITQAGFDDPGAENTHATEIIRHFVKHAVDVTVLHPSRRRTVRTLGARECVASIGGPRQLGRVWFQIWLLSKLWRRPPNVDAIYVRQAGLMIVPALLRRRLGIPIVGEFNTYFARAESARRIPLLPGVLRAIERKALKEYDKVVVVSSALKTAILDHYNIPSDRIAVVHNGTNLELMRPWPQEECRQALRLPANAFVVVFVGTLHPWQGISPLLTAIAQLSRTNGRDVHLVVAGTSRDQRRYEAEASTKGLTGRAHFVGAVEYERVPQVISAADVAVAPGDPSQSTDYRIRSPLKIYEYLACGRPVVAGDLDSIRELLTEHHVGFLVRPGSVTDLVSAIDALRNDPGLTARMGMNARHVAEQFLSWDACASRIIGVLRPVTTTSSPGHS